MKSESENISHSVMSDFLRPHGHETTDICYSVCGFIYSVYGFLYQEYVVYMVFSIRNHVLKLERKAG